MKANRNKRTIYLCGVDWQHHLGKDCDPTGAVVFNSVKDLKREKPCWKQCGIVKVDAKLVRFVARQKI